MAGTDAGCSLVSTSPHMPQLKANFTRVKLPSIHRHWRQFHAVEMANFTAELYAHEIARIKQRLESWSTLSATLPGSRYVPLPFAPLTPNSAGTLTQWHTSLLDRLQKCGAGPPPRRGGGGGGGHMRRTSVNRGVLNLSKFCLFFSDMSNSFFFKDVNFGHALIFWALPKFCLKFV